jgi:hypothetical protein
MRAEIDQLMTSNDELVDYLNYKQFTYNLAVFYEALRLHPSVPKVSVKWEHLGPYQFEELTTIACS